MKKTLVSVIVGAALGVVFVTSGTDAHASEVDGVWIPRTVDQIKADIAKAKDNKYKIVWGDTLSGISQATNLTVRKLADMNKIANVDLIYAGNTLVFEGNVVSVEDDKGETVAQTVIRPQDKNDANKPVGKQETPEKAVSDKSSEAGNTQASNAAPEQGSSTQNETKPSSDNSAATTSGTTTSTEKVETSQSTTSSQPTESKPVEKPNTPDKPITPTQQSTSGNQGGSTTPTTPEKDMVPINMGNSGKVFDSEEAASEYGYAEINNENSPWYDMRFGANELLDSNYNNTGKWTVDFLKDGFANE
ncbi:LysM peptidoglycan-binding domain-containing protein [Enterococcus gallinarum]|uniref:LysM peptidoglycan-binding domain-containing protein n=1 Tax=Enterococcus gallinarum TaxID=1353 RepID=UPI0020913E3C|nr:LysM peptidoglycan-binding domain-containing protein [Enterococcus gallinarum]MCO5478174.1 LysM peptidoglycan-binding domain-containing protein [Enterococcus gallinarum]